MREGWTYKTFGDIMSPARVIRCGERKLPVLSITMRNGIVGQHERFSKSIASIDTSNYKVVNNGQLVIAFPIDEGLIYTQDVVSEGIMSPAYNVWDVDYSCINRRFLVTFFHSSFAFAYYKAKLKGTTQRRRTIDKSDLLSMPIPVPPLAEQERIVAELDLLQGIIEKKKEQLKAYDQLAQSIFYTMFGDPIDNPKGWDVKKLGEIAYIGLGFTHSPEFVETGGIPFISVKDISSGKISFDEVRCVSEEEFLNAPKGAKPQKNDIMFCRVGTMGKPVIVKTDKRFCTFVSLGYLHLLNGDSNLYIKQWMESNAFDKQIEANIQGGTIKNLNTGWLKNFILPIPPLSLQEEFAEKVEAIEQQKALVQQSIDETQTMFDCTMDKYFG